MSGLLRSVRPSIATLLTTALVLGVNGFVGAIHSAHHLPAPVETHEHDAHDQEYDGGHSRPAPAGATDEGCPVADAALHLAAAEVDALPALDFSPAETELVATMPVEARRLASREPGSSRAPPSLHSPAS